jgi:hypothetical protein
MRGSRRRQRAADVLSLRAQQCSHPTKPVVFISQQCNGVGDVLNAAQIEMPDLRLAVGRRSFEFHSVAHTLALAFLRLHRVSTFGCPKQNQKLHVVATNRRILGQEDVRPSESFSVDPELQHSNHTELCSS